MEQKSNEKKKEKKTDGEKGIKINSIKSLYESDTKASPNSRIKYLICTTLLLPATCNLLSTVLLGNKQKINSMLNELNKPHEGRLMYSVKANFLWPKTQLSKLMITVCDFYYILDVLPESSLSVTLRVYFNFHTS